MHKDNLIKIAIDDYNHKTHHNLNWPGKTDWKAIAAHITKFLHEANLHQEHAKHHAYHYERMTGEKVEI